MQGEQACGSAQPVTQAHGTHPISSVLRFFSLTFLRVSRSVMIDPNLLTQSPRIAILAEAEVAKAHVASTEKDVSRLQVSVGNFLKQENIGARWQAKKSRMH